MRLSRAFIPTLKEVPKEATMRSHVLLLRAGCIRMVGAGLYDLLPMGLRALHKISAIVREEMDAAGAQEILMPALLPAEYYRESGRWDSFGDALIRLKDRKGGDYHLGPTHEEIVTDLARREVKSYKQLPLNLYQIQGKFRDEPRPRAGLLRCREFIMKDAYSFDADEAGAKLTYASMREAYHRIFRRLGLNYRIVEASSGAMGGSTSAEFQILAQEGEDDIVACGACGYAANLEVAEGAQAAGGAATSAELASAPPITTVHTPGAGGIDAVVKTLGGGLTAAGMLKCIVFRSGDRSIMAVVRGDREVQEGKLARHLGVTDLRLATDAEVQHATGAAVGFAGPVGFAGEIIVDHEVPAVRDAVTGANRSDHHLRHVHFGRDFNATVADIRAVGDGDACPRCGERLAAYRAIEGGHIFILGTHYSAKMGATFLDEQGQTKPLVMGCYGIGVSRLIAATIEQHNDEHGIRWPMAIAPYRVLVTPIGKEPAVTKQAEALYAELQLAGIDTLLDDRDERPGVKFKDADLLGIPLRVTVGARSLEKGQLEVKARAAEAPTMVAIDACVAWLRDAIEGALGEPTESQTLQ